MGHSSCESRRLGDAILRWLPERDQVFGVSDVCRSLAKKGYGSLTVGRFLRKSSLFRTATRDILLPEGFQQVRFKLTAAGQTAWDRVHPPQSNRRKNRRSTRSAARKRRAAAASSEVAGS